MFAQAPVLVDLLPSARSAAPSAPQLSRPLRSAAPEVAWALVITVVPLLAWAYQPGMVESLVHAGLAVPSESKFSVWVTVPLMEMGAAVATLCAAKTASRRGRFFFIIVRGIFINFFWERL